MTLAWLPASANWEYFWYGISKISDLSQWALFNDWDSETKKTLLKTVCYLSETVLTKSYSPCHERLPALRDHVIQIWLYTGFIVSLTHCGLVTPYGDTDLGQHWLEGNSLLSDGTKPLLNQSWLVISEVVWHSPEGNLTGNSQDTSDTTSECKAQKLVGHSQFCERSSPAVKTRAPTSSTINLW